MKLNDSNLFRQQALINGEWLDAEQWRGHRTSPIRRTATSWVACRKWALMKPAPLIDAANRALPAWRALTRQRTRQRFCATGSI